MTVAFRLRAITGRPLFVWALKTVGGTGTQGRNEMSELALSISSPTLEAVHALAFSTFNPHSLVR